MKKTRPTLTTVLFLCVATAMAQEAVKPATKIDPAPGWPMASGPYGNYAARKKGLKLVDDTTQIRVAWKNEKTDLGWAKAGSHVGGAMARHADSHPGAFSGPIIAAGKVFAASFRPSGKVFAKNDTASEPNSAWAKNAAILADDMVVAVDFETGKEVWRAEEKEAGLSHPMSKRGGWGAAPVYCKGFVVSLGTMGVLRAYDAETGEKRWETPIEPLHGMLQKCRKESLVKQNFVDHRPDVCLPMLVVGGVVIVGQHRDGTVCGVDPASGKVLWSIPNAVELRATPGIWRHEGKEYLITCSGGFDATAKKPTGVLRCIEPLSGKVLWSLPGVGENFAPFIVEGDILLINISDGTTMGQVVKQLTPEQQARTDPSKIKPEATNRMCVLAGFRLSLTGAVKAWQRPSDFTGWHHNWSDTAAMRRTLAQDGRVYTFNCAVGHSPAVRFSILDVETGKELGGWWPKEEAMYPNRGQSFLVEGRLLNYLDAAHGGRLTGQLYSLSDNNIKPLGGLWKPQHENTSGYQTFMETPIADGKLVMRSHDGGLWCYDLRKKD